MPGIMFKNGAPTYNGDTVIRCFKKNDNGLLFRIVNTNGQKWAFYNDTTNYNMVVTVVFGDDSEIEPLGNTTMSEDPKNGEYTCEVRVAPGATEMFIKGRTNGFKTSYLALPCV